MLLRGRIRVYVIWSMTERAFETKSFSPVCVSVVSIRCDRAVVHLVDL